MKLTTKISFLLLVTIFIAGKVKAQEPSIIKWNEMELMINPKSDTTYLINFWATWCAPCVKELPHFEQLAAENVNRKFKLVLISLDFKSQFESRLKKFVVENSIKSQVYLLNEPDYNTWIDKIAPDWNGSIPASLIVNTQSGIRKFYEKEFTYSEIAEIINPLIQK